MSRHTFLTDDGKKITLGLSANQPFTINLNLCDLAGRWARASLDIDLAKAIAAALSHESICAAVERDAYLGACEKLEALTNATGEDLVKAVETANNESLARINEIDSKYNPTGFRVIEGGNEATSRKSYKEYAPTLREVKAGALLDSINKIRERGQTATLGEAIAMAQAVEASGVRHG